MKASRIRLAVGLALALSSPVAGQEAKRARLEAALAVEAVEMAVRDDDEVVLLEIPAE